MEKLNKKTLLSPWGNSCKPKAASLSKCKLEGNGHMPSGKHMSNIEMSSITLRDIPGYLPSKAFPEVQIKSIPTKIVRY